LRKEAASEAGVPETLQRQAQWDSFAFIDLCQACVEGHSPIEPVCRAIQHREWELLFDCCFRAATEA
jgi:hypothetical protein